MRWPSVGPLLELDRPIPGSSVSATVEISGWAVARGAAIERVEVSVAGAAALPLDYGLSRPEIAAVHGGDPACGFHGALSLPPSPDGPLSLEVSAIDARGRRGSRSVAIDRHGDDARAAAEGRLEVERACWTGETLDVEGFAVAPAGSSWRSLRVEADGVTVGIARLGISRPDLAERFAPRETAIRSGFRFCGRVTRAGRIVLTAEADSGAKVRRLLSYPPRPDERSFVEELSRWISALEEELGRGLAILDATGHGLAAALPGMRVVTPLDAATLPYLDATFDVVAVGREDDGLLREARRLARRAVVRVSPGTALQTLWQGAPAGRRLPSVSLVIPVHDQSAYTEECLRAVRATWPAAVEGEVLVVDDGSTDETPQRAGRWSQEDPRLRVIRFEENRGFVAACNAGAAAATGEVLVFLNNDTVPRPGWLLPLLRALERECAGAAGGRLLYPDGSLQEAGGVVFADGNGCNFGRGDREPDHPLFACLREVDYCSAALLATPRALFLRLGGFDPAFAPAYYEDTDYAFRLRQQGYRVYYQPESEVVHVEGATAGRDPADGVKRHQPINRVTFAARWAGALVHQPLRPPAIDRAALHELRARGRRARRALVSLPTMPEHDRESGSRRAFHMIELLLEAGWATSVLVENATGGERCARELRQLGAAVYSGPATRGAGADYLEDPARLLALERFDIALLVFWYLAERQLPALRACSPHTRVLVDSVDLHFLREARAAFAAAPRRTGALDRDFADRLRCELNVYAAADRVLTVSPKEAAWIDDLVGAPGHARCVPDLEDPAGPPRPRGERNGLLFLGNFRHPPNVDALALLAEVVERLDPALLAAQPLSIVGNALEPAMLGPLAGHPHVRAVGWVPDVTPYLERALVSLAPLRQGAGTKRKVLQSLLAGTPVVSTTLGAEGLGVEDGRELVVAEGALDLALAVMRLVRDEAAWGALAQRGRLAAERAHARDVVRPLFHAAVETP